MDNQQIAITDPMGQVLAIAHLQDRVSHLENKLDRINKTLEHNNESIQELLDAWKTSLGVVSFVKWLGGAAVAVTAIYHALMIFKK
ncbi:hypothetical protein UFOVP67_14 [uncultured Caudovirales phage]|uniref:Uncharacterized protein n=1 Tax=uncultured Caudovirales phage TaxID=2100421 RepID=A0A6J5TCC7_9CAUD|nr:hypothetical protein UFOVP67_14 [uncultured Caudovirales phage]